MKKITIDTTEKKYPIFLYKETENLDVGYIYCEVGLSENKEYSGRILSISTNGKYIVELLEEKN